MDGIKTAMQQINELPKKIYSGDENLQNQINELFNKVRQLERTNKSLQERGASLNMKNRKLKDQNGQLREEIKKPGEERGQALRNKQDELKELNSVWPVVITTEMMTLSKNNFEAASLVEYGRLVGGYVYCFYIN